MNKTTVQKLIDNIEQHEDNFDMNFWVDTQIGLLSDAPIMEFGLPGCGTTMCAAGWLVFQDLVDQGVHTVWQHGGGSLPATRLHTTWMENSPFAIDLEDNSWIGIGATLMEISYASAQILFLASALKAEQVIDILRDVISWPEEETDPEGERMSYLISRL